MRITESKGLIGERTSHDYDYSDKEKGLFAIFFPFSPLDSFYGQILSESVKCADLDFMFADVKHPSLTAYISEFIYNTQTMMHYVIERNDYLSVPVAHPKKQGFIPKEEIDKAISMILGSNKIDAYLTTYNRNGTAVSTVTIPHPFVSVEMKDGVPVITMQSL